MKKIQILKAAFLVLAVGGAIISKGNSKFTSTRFTLSNTPTAPCSLEAHSCQISGSVVCSQLTTGHVNKKFYYSDASCVTPLFKIGLVLSTMKNVAKHEI